MSDNYVQSASASSGLNALTIQATLNGVTAGNTIVAFLFDGASANGGTDLSGVADGQGAYTAKGSAPFDSTDEVVGQVFVLLNANSGTHVITGTVNSSVDGSSCDICVAEIGTSAGASAYSGTNAAFQTNPGAGSDAISSGNATVTGAATLLAFCVNTPVGNATADEPAIGTGFTSRNSGADNNIGAWTLESKAVSTNAAGTCTAVSGQGGSSYMTLAVAILNAAGGGSSQVPVGSTSMDPSQMGQVYPLMVSRQMHQQRSRRTWRDELRDALRARQWLDSLRTC